jgi:2-C-methyl-D-erythritol 4-phosphate cytidylyltransferase
MPKTACIIVAAGSGMRLGAKKPKAFAPVNGKPMIEHSLYAFQNTPEISEMILVKPPSYSAGLNSLFARFTKLAAIVSGGKERSDSVRAGLDFLSSDIKIVLIHDAARPLITPAQIRSVIAAVKKHGAAILAEPVTDTIKSAKGHFISKTIPRDGLWRAQTPQGFERDLILKAHKNNRTSTDDSLLVENMRKKVCIVPAVTDNMKITTKSDLEIASWLLRKRG